MKITFVKIVTALAVLLLVYSFAVERYWVTNPEIEIFFDNLPRKFDGYRIAVISDVHRDTLVPEWWVRRAFRQAMALNPDAITGLGDYVRGREEPALLQKAWALLRELKARDGVFLVNGNHDHWADLNLSLELLEESGVSVRHIYKTVTRGGSRLLFCGTGDLYCDIYEIDHTLRTAREEDFRIVLAHNPDTADFEHTSRVDLYLSGHTHGGQIRIPFLEYSPLLPVDNKNYDLGLKANSRGEKIFISKGVGYSIAPLRFNVYPEIPIIVLRRK